MILKPEFRYFIPNAFSPDGDGSNDIFKPSIMGVHNYKFYIYNRWGEMIFETNELNRGWNGYFDGRLCPIGVYVYRITFNSDIDGTFQKYTGKVVLLN